MAQPGRPKKIRYQSPKGMRDILANDLKYFEKIFDVASDIAQYYGFKRIETPILEQAELFSKGIGMATEIVERQMYILKSKGGDVLALRPEGTAPVVRAYIEKGMPNLSKPVKLWYFGPFFRHEKPQAGRFRQFWQFGFEILGDRNPVIDAQVIKIFINILGELKLKKLGVQINSLGCQKCGAHFRKLLIRYLKSSQMSLCVDCKKRLKENPLRILDCKQEKCGSIVAQGPQILDYLCKECRFHFKEVLEFLDELAILYELNPYLVRGLDYYTKTVFEIFLNSSIKKENIDYSQIARPPAGSLASEIGQALAGGGRYDNLIRLLGGKDTPGCGAAAGVERIVEMMKLNEFKFSEPKKSQVFLAQLGSVSKRRALTLFEEFRKAKVPVVEAFGRDSLRAQLARVNRLGIKYALILGEKETLEGKIILRDMEKGSQETLKLEKIVDIIKKKVKH